MEKEEYITSLISENFRSQAEFARIAGVKLTTLRSILQSGISRASVGNAIKICKALGLDVEFLNPKADSDLTKKPAGTANGLNIPDALSNIVAGLNEPGLDALMEYGSFLLSKTEYKAKNGERKKTIRTIRDYRTPAAAGYASPIEGEDYEDLPVDENTPRGADFSVHVQGDSMEPYIKDGSRVFVQRDVNLRDFDVGVFYVDGDVYCKQICQDHVGNLYLLSANPKRQNANITIRHDSNRSLVCFGKVILPKPLPQPVYY